MTVSDVVWRLEPHDAGDEIIGGLFASPTGTITAPYDGFVYRWSAWWSQNASSYLTGDTALHSTGCGVPAPPANFPGVVLRLPAPHKTWNCLPSWWHGDGVDGTLDFYYTTLPDLLGGSRPLRPGDTVENETPVPLGPGETQDYDTFLQELQDLIADPEANGVPPQRVTDIEQLGTCLDYLAGDPAIPTPATGDIDPCGQRVGDPIPDVEDPDAPPVGDTRPAPIDPGPIGDPIETAPRPRCEANPARPTVEVPEILQGESLADYEDCLETLGLESAVSDVAATVLDSADGAPVITDPIPGTSVEPATEVRIPSVSACRTDTPMFATVDPRTTPHPPTTTHLRWGTTAWGWRKIRREHGYDSEDASQTQQAVTTWPEPIRFWRTNWNDLLPFTRDVPGRGRINCVRVVAVSFELNPKQGNNVQGITNSYAGLDIR